MKNDTIYMVQEINGYGGWGETYYGDVIATFKTRDEAEIYCHEHHLTGGMASGWPSIAIVKQEIRGKRKDESWGGYF